MRKFTSLFSTPFEALNLAIPVIGLLYTIYDSASGSAWSSPRDKLLIDFSRNIVFFSATHSLIPIFTAIYSPSFRSLISESTNARPHVFWGKVGGLFCGLFLLSYAGISSKDGELEMFSNGIWGVLIYVFFTAYYLHHVISQVFGFSVLYNKQENNLSPGFLAMERRERRLFLILTVLVIGYFSLARTLVFIGASPEIGRLFEEFFPIVSAALILAILINGFSGGASRRSNKWIFLLRLFNFPLSIFSYTARGMITVFHGVETICLFHKVIKRDGARLRPFGWLLFFALSLVLTWLSLWQFTGFDSVAKILPKTGELFDKFVLAFLLSISSVHYYIERVFYRMRNPRVREKILPILVESGAVAASK